MFYPGFSNSDQSRTIAESGYVTLGSTTSGKEKKAGFLETVLFLFTVYEVIKMLKD